MTCRAHDLAAEKTLLEQEDVDLIIEMCQALPDGATVVELGAGVGTTAVAVFCGCPDKRLYFTSVDYDNTSLAHTCEEVTALGRFAEWESVLQGTAPAARFFTETSIDFLLLDASHSYEGFEEELRLWLPKIKAGGLVWIHDYIGRVGVRQSVDEAVLQRRISSTQQRGLSWAGTKCG